ncbi:serine/arginine repetitive matrix protein 3-like [Pongo pygmaeus]|uniref:serine/arginine repetitive matrix protein 3-like n=1 Tax=Pongo pygmaeus TaxID=9600 RepID=UPI0023E12743|nr:serine/arginine repetitive matrix protein 3-like [Pongo pygmaeus]
MCVPSPEHTLRTLSTNRRGEGEAPPPAPSTYTPRRTRPAPARLTPGPLRERQRRRRLAGGSRGCWLRRPRLPPRPPPPPPGGALTRHRGGGRCKELPGSSALTTPHVRGRLWPLPAAAGPASLAPAPRDAGHGRPKWPRLVSNSWPQVILLPQPLKILGLQHDWCPNHGVGLPVEPFCCEEMWHTWNVHVSVCLHFQACSVYQAPYKVL